jgi:flagellar biosynthesis protein FlhF
MHVKRLYRPTVREALAAARETLGPSALVLSTELVPAPGWRGWVGQRVVRLTAAAERPDAPVADNPDFELVSADRTIVTEVTASRHPALTGPQAGVAARLAATGLSRAFADAVAARLTTTECRATGDRALRRALVAELAVNHDGNSEFARYEVFVGPPGVGKTTTIAKIAAQERATGTRPLGLVAADAFRAGAIEQLRSYASVIGVPFRVARTAAELDQALDATRHTAFVDTAGKSPADSSISDLFEVLDKRRDVRTHLVLAADTSPATAVRILDRYAVVKPSCVAITKLDEADSVIPLFNVIRERGLALSYLTDGQNVPDDLERATPASLAAALLRESGAEAVCH